MKTYTPSNILLFPFTSPCPVEVVRKGVDRSLVFKLPDFHGEKRAATLPLPRTLGHIEIQPAPSTSHHTSVLYVELDPPQTIVHFRSFLHVFENTLSGVLREYSYSNPLADIDAKPPRYNYELVLSGTGYRVELKRDAISPQLPPYQTKSPVKLQRAQLSFYLGNSHEDTVDLPLHVGIKDLKPSSFSLICEDKQVLGNAADMLISLKPRNVYTGAGVISPKKVYPKLKPKKRPGSGKK